MTSAITFNFNTSPVDNQGEQTMHIPAGAFNQASNNDPVLEFTARSVTTPRYWR